MALYLYQSDDYSLVLVVARDEEQAEELLKEEDDGREYTLQDWYTVEPQVIRGVFI